MSSRDPLQRPIPLEPGETAPARRGRTTAIGVIALVAIVGMFAALIAGSILSPTPPHPDSTASLRVLADPGATYDPVSAGEDLPSGFRQLLRRDAILPIYDPEFISDAENVRWADDTLVIGLAIDGEAKAYPVSFLNRREMVVDSIAGIPVLVTW